MLMHNKKNIVITGGSSGFGKALVNSLAIKHGNRIFVFSRRKVIEHIENVSHFQCDISKDSELKRMHELINNDVGKVDVWINNAAVSGGFKRFDEMSHKIIRDTINTNLSASILNTKFAIDIMKQQEGQGHIFNISGAGGNHSNTPLFSVYGSTKSAIVQFSKTVQHELKGSNISLHILSPGLMRTNLLLDDLDSKTFAIMDIIAENPTTVAEHMSNQIMITCGESRQTFLRYFNVPNMIRRLVISKFQ